MWKWFNFSFCLCWCWESKLWCISNAWRCNSMNMSICSPAVWSVMNKSDNFIIRNGYLVSLQVLALHNATFSEAFGIIFIFALSFILCSYFPLWDGLIWCLSYLFFQYIWFCRSFHTCWLVFNFYHMHCMAFGFFHTSYRFFISFPHCMAFITW